MTRIYTIDTQHPASIPTFACEPCILAAVKAITPDAQIVVGVLTLAEGEDAETCDVCGQVIA